MSIKRNTLAAAINLVLVTMRVEQPMHWMGE